MIKRRFYKVDRKDEVSDSSSSDSSGSTSEEEEEKEEEEEVEERSSGKEEEEEDDDDDDDDDDDEASLNSGYEGEDSSGNDIKCDSSGLLFDEVEGNAGINRQGFKKQQLVPEATSKRKPNDRAEIDDSIKAEVDEYILACKSIFKCRICPRIVCLNEESVIAHLKSKRHARSKKLLEEGRLKQMLNSDGEIEEEAETHAERLARTVTLAQKSATPNKNKGRQRQRKRRAERRLGGKRSKTDHPPSTIPANNKKRKVKD